MSDRSTELKVGITVLLAVVILVIGVAWIGQYRLTKEGYPLEVRFADVGGLDVGDPVTVAGMERGRVQAIELEADAVRVQLWLEPDVVLDEDAAIAIDNIGMMGEKYVAIRRGNSPRSMDLTEVQEGIYRPGLMEMLGELGGIVETAREEIPKVSSSLSGFSDVSLGDTLKKLEQTVEDISSMISENRGDIRAGVEDFRAASTETRRLIEETRDEARGAFSSVDRATSGIDTTMLELRTLVRSLQEITNRIEEGEGTFGKAVNDDQLHDEMVRTLRELDALVEDIRANPKKYFGLSVF